MVSPKTRLKQPELTIVIPALREEQRIGSTLDELAGFLKHDLFFKRKDVEVLVVAADSPDKTKDIVLAKRKLFKHLILLEPGPEVGKGRDVQVGMLRASGKVVIYMDADLATPLHHLERFYKACVGGSDIVAGTRNILKHHPSVIRRAISNIGNILFQVAGGVWIEDSQCGFKMFRKRAAQICFTKLTIMGWGFDMEILTIAHANNLKIASYRIDDWRSVPGGTFTEDMLRTTVRSLGDLGLIVLGRLTGAYRDRHDEQLESYKRAA
jgi:glycosyltransferase involved in cell wall biosynthesis